MRAKRQTSFSLPSFRKFKIILGEFSTLINFEETATIHLLSEKKEDESTAAMLKRVAPVHGIRIADVTLPHFEIVLRKAFLNHPFACFEAFLDEFKRDFQSFVNPDFSLVDDDDISKLERFTKSLKREGIVPQIDGYLFDMYRYYRLIRNDVVHHLDNSKVLERAYHRIEANRESIIARFGIMPNDSKQIDYSDFKLCDMVLIEIAELMSIALERHLNWETIASTDASFISKIELRKIKEKPSSQKTYINHCFKHVFGINAPSIAISTILNLI